MKHNENNFKVCGILYDHNLEIKQYGPNSKKAGKTYIRGEVTVATDEDMLNTTPVYFNFIEEFYNKKDESGKPRKNPAFDYLKRIIDNNETVKNGAYGKDGALRVEINGSLECNDFCARDTGEPVVQKRLFGKFIRNAGNTEFQSKFEVDALIKGFYIRNEDDEDKETYGVLDCYVFDFFGNFHPFKFNVRIPGAIKYFEKELDENKIVFTRLKGELVNQVVTRQIEEECAFGDPIVHSVSSNFRSWDIYFAASTPYEYGEDGDITPDEIKAGLKARNEKLESIKENWNKSHNKSAFEAPASSVEATPFDEDDDFSF